MSPTLRALGVAALAGGALRVADSFSAQLFSGGMLAALYFVTDVLLLLGIAGLYWSRRATLGVAGVIGTAVFTAGILLVRISAFGVLGANGYQLGATIALLGLALLSVETLLRRSGGHGSAVLWLLALALGVVGVIGIMPAVMIVLAGVAFGAGFVAAGTEILTA
jgi:hypothetical protein